MVDNNLGIISGFADINCSAGMAAEHCAIQIFLVNDCSSVVT